MLRATADSNIYISALNFGGTPDKVLDLGRSGEVRLAISDFILGEIGRVLGDKFGWRDEESREAQAQIAGFCEHVTPDRRVYAVRDDPTDNGVLECAIEAGSEYLVTGDRHLLALRQFENVRIVSPAAFLEIQRASAKS